MSTGRRATSHEIRSLQVDLTTKLIPSALQISHGTVNIQTVKQCPCIDVLCAALIVVSDTSAIGHVITVTAKVDLIHAGIVDAPKFAQS